MQQRHLLYIDKIFCLKAVDINAAGNLVTLFVAAVPMGGEETGKHVLIHDSKNFLVQRVVEDVKSDENACFFHSPGVY